MDRAAMFAALLLLAALDPAPDACRATATLESGGRRYVACAGGEYLIYEGSVLRERRAADGEVRGFFEHGGRVWIEVARTEARPLAITSSTAAPGPAPAIPPPISPVARRTGAVVELGAGEVTVDLGSDAGLVVGAHVELYRVDAVDLGGGQSSTRDVVLAIGEVIALSASRAQVRLGMNERVPKGSLARTTAEPLTTSRVAPPRAGGLWETRFDFRPFLPLDTLGFGMISSFSFGRRFEGPLFVQAVVEPLGLGLAKEGNIFPLAANLFAAFDLPIFEIGLGLGWTAINSPSRPAGSTFDTPLQRGSGLSIAQVVRLGALDGLHLYVRNAFALRDEQFNYAATNGTLQVPLLDGVWLIGRGGGGRSGYAFGEGGLRFLLEGNGDRGSVFLTATLGGVTMFAVGGGCTSTPDPVRPGNTIVTCDPDPSYGGPLVGFGMEWRN